MIIVSISDNHEHPGAIKLRESLEKLGYEYEFITARFLWGGQMQTIAEWCKGQPDEDWFIYIDNWDSVAMWRVIEYDLEGKKMLISAEKNCYPDESLATQYPASESAWKYVNGGGFMCEVGYFKKLFGDGIGDVNDQLWLAQMYLAHPDEIALDTGCEIFQTLWGEGGGDCEMRDGIFHNNRTNSNPAFIHANGRSVSFALPSLYEHKDWGK